MEDETEESDLETALLSMLTGLFGSDEAETKTDEPETAVVPSNVIAAESKEQFFGTWKLSRVVIGSDQSFSITMEDVAAMLGFPFSIEIALADGSLSFIIEGDESAEAFDMGLADGALNLTKDGETVTLYLTDAGEIVLGIGAVNLCFTPAAETANAVQETVSANE